MKLFNILLVLSIVKKKEEGKMYLSKKKKKEGKML